MDALEPAQIYDTAQVSQPFEPAAVRAESCAHQRMLASIPKLRVKWTQIAEHPGRAIATDAQPMREGPDRHR
jgi:hypothetical protein